MQVPQAGEKVRVVRGTDYGVECPATDKPPGDASGLLSAAHSLHHSSLFPPHSFTPSLFPPDRVIPPFIIYFPAYFSIHPESIWFPSATPNAPAADVITQRQWSGEGSGRVVQGGGGCFSFSQLAH